MIAKFIHLLLRKLSGNTDLQTEQPTAQISETKLPQGSYGFPVQYIEINRRQNNLNHAYDY